MLLLLIAVSRCVWGWGVWYWEAHMHMSQINVGVLVMPGRRSKHQIHLMRVAVHYSLWHGALPPWDESNEFVKGVKVSEAKHTTC